MTIEIGAVRFDEAVLYRQLKQDMKDDWFPDPILFTDLFDTGTIATRIGLNVQRNHGVFRADERTVLNLPKPNFTLRYALEVGIGDRALYQGLTSFLSKQFDSVIPWRVYSHRRDHHRQNDRYMFRKGVPAWRDFVGSVRSGARSHDWLLSTDLTNYFENIDTSKLRSVLEEELRILNKSDAEKSEIKSHIDLLFQLLSNWTFDKNRGLPQNRDASSFLANMYMLPVDRAMLAHGFEYFRYMDDIKVVCGSKYEARRALKLLSIELRARGLAVNSKKTEICETKDNEAIDRCLDGSSPQVEQLEALWSTRRREPVSQSFPMLRDLAQTLLRKGDVDTREFRYCMTRLVMLASCHEFSVPAAYFSDITDLVVDALGDHPTATDQFAKYLRAVDLSQGNVEALAMFLRDGQKNFYSWQCYRLWMLAGQKGIVQDDLLDHAAAIIRSDNDGANRAGATLFAGAHGGADRRELIADRFPTLKSFLGQRSAIIAIQEVPFGPKMRESVGRYLRPDLAGVYRTLKTRPATYFAPMERVSISQIIDGERDYA